MFIFYSKKKYPYFSINFEFNDVKPSISGSESGDETLSKASASGGDKHTDSWAEDTDVSSAMDDHRKKVRT